MRGSEEITVGEDVAEGLAAIQLEDVGTATRAVMRATTRALKEARATPKLTLPTETEAGRGGIRGWHNRHGRPRRGHRQSLQR